MMVALAMPPPSQIVSSPYANSYYFDTRGDVILRPGTTAGTYWRAKRFPLQDYRFTTPITTSAKESTSAGH